MQEKVKTPAIALIIAGCISALVSLASLGMNVLGMGMGAMHGMGGDSGGGPNPQMMQMMSGGVGIAAAIVGLIVQVIIILGATKMMKLESYGLSMTAAVLAAIPCFGCCLVNMPIGIWAIITLADAGVKAAFAGGAGGSPMAGAPPTMPPTGLR